MKPSLIIIVLTVAIMISFLVLHNASAQNITADTTLAAQYYRKAKQMIDKRQFNKFDSILLLSDNAAKLYGKHKAWEGLLVSLGAQLQSYVNSTKQQESYVLFDSISKISKQYFGDKNVYLANAYFSIGLLNKLQNKFDNALQNYFIALELKKELYGEKNIAIARYYNNIGSTYLSKGEYNNALSYFFKGLELQKELLGEKHVDIAVIYNNIGNVYLIKSEYGKAFEFYDKSLTIKKNIFGEKNVDVATTYSNIGNVYYSISEYNKALEFQFKGLAIRTDLFGEKHPDVAASFNNIGTIYYHMSDYNNALEYFFKSMNIRKKLGDENNIDLAACYNNIGNVYQKKSESDKALDYLFKSLEIKLKILGEKHFDVATSYNNIGNVYHSRAEYDKALEYHLKSLVIKKELFGEKNYEIVTSYNNIGTIYSDKLDYDKALDYYFKSLEVAKELFGEKSVDIAVSYNNIGAVYFLKSDLDKALDFYSRSLEMRKQIFREKHIDIAYTYNNLGKFYFKKMQFDAALRCYHLGIASSLKDFNDTINVNTIPAIKNYIEHSYLLKNLHDKAECLIALSNLPDCKNISELRQLALLHYQAADTLINQVREKIAQKTDKIALGEQASKIYENAIKLCLTLPNLKDLSFYFSEKNKAMVLQSQMAQTNALEMSDLPDSLLRKEKQLKIDITYYEGKLINEGTDSTYQAYCKDKLFDNKRAYENLIRDMEINYPDYYNLSHNLNVVKAADISKSLDKKTALISYLLGDSTLTVFTITKNGLDVQQVPINNNFATAINFYRTCLMSNKKGLIEKYPDMAFQFYKQLFPKELPRKIKNLIIIPDGVIGKIPFETLLTEKYEAAYQDKNDETFFRNMPFLINKYNVSYAISATLFVQKLNNQTQQQPVKDLLAMAPVFDNQQTAGGTLATRSLLSELNLLHDDSLQTRSISKNGNSIAALPGSLTEVEKINQLFNENNKTTTLKSHNQANEQFVKSDDLKNYKIIHIASHGVVNQNNPEFSGILLAQDSTSGEDGFLRTGEIYNLHINAGLVVLSACETGLGQQKKGEGIIGLTRALMYAGAQNICVSLWKVSDESTSLLMIDFYRNILTGKNSYSSSLRNAKLKMIKEGKFAHPFYWSPFVLIGK